MKYISRIINSYQRENIKTVQQAQERERNYIETINNNKYINKKQAEADRIKAERDKWCNE